MFLGMAMLDNVKSRPENHVLPIYTIFPWLPVRLFLSYLNLKIYLPFKEKYSSNI